MTFSELTIRATEKSARAFHFFGAMFEEMGRRARGKGWKCALIFARSKLTDLYLRQREKFMRSPKVECPCCGWTGYDFYSMDGVFFYLPSVHCPRCRCCERHRMLQLYITRHDPDLFKDAERVLHCAPDREGGLRGLMGQNTAAKVFSTDFSLRELQPRSGPKFVSDVQSLPLAGESVDVAFCLHVLEHVRGDRQAVGELHRVLKPGGIAYVMVPFMPGITQSYALDQPDDIDHIWMYALDDFKNRLTAFDVREVTPKSFLTPAEIRRYRIPDKEIIYCCVKH
ncbi:MAG: class I SAM-dependent methyltransferase [Candidatus Hydrogenedentes bacterium]|nr:class I SAM-dependent methyltransferase [Candidatus Hydrogenedentota bacterium]